MKPDNTAQIFTQEEARIMYDCLEEINTAIFESKTFWNGDMLERLTVIKILDQLNKWGDI